MSLLVKRGQKTDLTKKYSGLGEILVGIGWETTGGGLEIDAAAFMLQGSGKCRGDEDFIFYGNPTGRNGAVTVQNPRTPDKAQIKVNLGLVPLDVDRIAFTLTIYEGPQRGHSFGQIPSAFLRLSTTGNEEIIRFDMGRDFSSETAIVVAELYRHNGEWKFSPIAMGYQGGLAALCGSFGITVSSKENEQRKGEPAPRVEVSKHKISEPPKQKLNLSKIELTKKGEKINLAKKAGNKLGEILVNLNWNQTQTQKSTGFLDSFLKRKQGIDLDLGCLVEMTSGKKFVIQSLGNSFGSLNSVPYISLDGDDRTGAVSTGENIRINGNQIPQFKRILIFAYIYEGIANWAQADGVITIQQPGGPDIIVRLDEHDPSKIMCGIAMIENINNETFSIERLVRYFSGHRELDEAYGWGFRWQKGSKN